MPVPATDLRTPSTATHGLPTAVPSTAPQVRITNVVKPPEPVPAFEPVSLDSADEPDEEPPPAGAPVFARSGKDDPTRSQSERWRAALETVREASTRLGASLSHARVLWMRPGDITVG